ncbi:MAG: hypothetical protein P4M06_12840 [Pandoraea sp.]|nr:hypothetical protein [Pandoraea sp.]MDR3398436.1 hypothetical protein [Pandoraea sp.]
MPPRHATPQTQPAICAIRAIASLRFGLIALCLLLASGVARVHAQSMPPAVATPADPFHQPCVEVRVSPQAVGVPRVVTHLGIAVTTPPQRPLVRKQYVDLDDRCASPPAFAPTRDIDSTSVWYVDAPAGGLQATSRLTDARALRGLAS